MYVCDKLIGLFPESFANRCGPKGAMQEQGLAIAITWISQTAMTGQFHLCASLCVQGRLGLSGAIPKLSGQKPTCRCFVPFCWSSGFRL